MSPFGSSLLVVVSAVVVTSAIALDELHQQCPEVVTGQIWSRDIPISLPPVFISNPDSYIDFPDQCVLNNMYLLGTEIVACNVEAYGPQPELIPDDYYNPRSPIRVLCRPEFNSVNRNVNWCPLGVKANAVQYCSPYSTAYIGRDGAPQKE